MDFTHIHLHSSYSILDGCNKIEPLITRIKELGMTSVALTDHGVMSGALEFYKECKEQGIRPCIGIEAYITDDPDDLPKEERTRDNHHLVMIARDIEGYRNLLWMSSNAFMHNMYYKPRIWRGHLETHSAGITTTSACLGGFPNHLAEWNPEEKTYSDPEGKAEEMAIWFHKTFDGNYYLEIQDNDDDAQQQLHYNHFLIDIARRNDIPLVITADAHYLNKEDHELHGLTMAMQYKQTLEEYAQNAYKHGPWFYVRSPQEMWEAANKYDCPEAFENTLKIASECNLELDLETDKPPVYNMDEIEDKDDFEEWLKTRHDH